MSGIAAHRLRPVGAGKKLDVAGAPGLACGMARVALLVAATAVLAAALPSPGLFVALGAGIAAIGTGWLVYRRPAAPGFARLAGAAAITVGAMGCVLGALRVALALAAIDHLDHLLG